MSTKHVLYTRCLLTAKQKAKLHDKSMLAQPIIEDMDKTYAKLGQSYRVTLALCILVHT